jgi:hypothetical protein
LLTRSLIRSPLLLAPAGALLGEPPRFELWLFGLRLVCGKLLLGHDAVAVGVDRAEQRLGRRLEFFEVTLPSPSESNVRNKP